MYVRIVLCPSILILCKIRRQVLHHSASGKIIPSKISFSPNDRYFSLAPEAQSMFSISKQSMVRRLKSQDALTNIL